MKKSLIAAIAILVLLAAVFFATKSRRIGQSQKIDQTDAVKVRLKWLHQAQFAGFYTANEKGFYKEKGIEAILNPGGPDFPAVQMVASGSEDFGVTGADQILLARDKGVPIVAIAVIYRESPFCYFSLKDSGVTRVQDFVGKKIGVKLGGNEELTYRAMMKKAGVDAKSVTEEPVKFDLTPLLEGRVLAWPGYSINEPIAVQEQGFEVNYIWPKDYGVSLYADTLFTTEAMIRDRPELVQRFVTATMKGWNYAIAHQDEVVDFTLKQSEKLKKAHETAMMAASIRHLKPDDKTLGSMEKSKWEELHKLLLELNFLKKPVDIDTAFTVKFLE